MTDGVAIVEAEVRELIRRTGVDPVRNLAAARDLVNDAVLDYDERSLAGGLPSLVDVPGTVKQLLDAVAGLGPLQQYLDDPTVEEI